MLLLTTPDYLPKLGGLSTHTQNVEKVLKTLGIPYELFVWNNYQEIVSYPKEKLASFKYILNIHSGFHMYMPESPARVINFVNGAEILFYSPSWIKHLIKQLTRKKAVRRVEAAWANIFISQHTFEVMQSKGLRPDYSRDLVFNMCVDIQGHEFIEKKWDAPVLRFICVARDVPHKNFKGCIRFCEKVQELSGRQVEFISVTNKKFESDKIKITSYINPSNQQRDELLRQSHINLLLSLDQSKKGFFEGFGQIVQEAGMFGTPSLVFNTGGLPESAHDGFTGWVIDDVNDKIVSDWLQKMDAQEYRRISLDCYDHTIASHGLDNWKRLFEKLIHAK